MFSFKSIFYQQSQEGSFGDELKLNAFSAWGLVRLRLVALGEAALAVRGEGLRLGDLCAVYLVNFIIVAKTLPNCGSLFFLSSYFFHIISTRSFGRS